MGKGLGAVLGIIAVIVIAVAVVYNRIVSKRNQAESAWSNIDVQLKRRFDLIPNLVETVRAYAGHEREVFERITQLRNGFDKAASPGELGEISSQMDMAVKSLFAVSENYPDLKASGNFLMLQEALAGTENRIAYSRNNYNNSVMAYNTAIQTFPGTLVAGIFGFRTKEFFQLEDTGQRKNIEVQLN